MTKQNCWEVKKCGREPGGAHVDTLGGCPAATAGNVDGIHGGKNGGRCCWVVVGTLCEGSVQGTFAQKLRNCLACDFHKQVAKEEAKNLMMAGDILVKLNQTILSKNLFK